MSQPLQAGLDRGRVAVTGLRAFRAELGRMVNSALVSVGGSAPDLELVESEDGWYVVARLPGVAPEEVALEIDGRDLCIRARSEEEVNADSGMPGAGSRERGFAHRIRLPGEADLERIDAVMDHGLLTVALPKAVRSGRRTITVGRRYPSGRSTPDGSGSPSAGTTSGTTALPAGATARRVGESALTAGTSARAGGGLTHGTVDPAADRELHQPAAGSSRAARRHVT
jgi:HSP20 family protein